MLRGEKMFIKIRKSPKFSILLFNRNLLEISKHGLMKLSIDKLKLNKDNYNNIEFMIEEVSGENIEKMENPEYKVKDIKKIHLDNKGYSYGLMATIDGKMIAMIFGLYKGGRGNHYVIKHSDLYLHHIYVDSKYRGNRIAEYMMRQMINKVQRDKEVLKSVTLAVREDNVSAIKAYERMGFCFYKTTRFITIGKWNIPQIKI